MAEDLMTLTPLGSGQEVGRSCHLLEFKGWKILLDCGVHPGYDGINGLPFLDRLEPDEVDIVLITHFHLDHAASLPYLTERTAFKGRVFMTHPTKAVMRLLLGDYIRLLQMKNAKAEDVLYTAAELNSCLQKVEVLDYHTTVTLQEEGRGLSFYALNAGHVLGACMYVLTFGGRSILYTGDYSMEDDRHLMAAEIPRQTPDLLIAESTYGVQVHASRAEREARFTGTVERIVTRGGRCLIPVFALGRAQELLLILDEYWQANPQLQDIPIYYASKLASRALRVYQTYANMMNARIRSQMDVGNPFDFSFIRNLKSIDVNTFDDSGPSVVFASPGMLQSGVSRQLFDRWAGNPLNGVLIAGYAVEHTLAKEIMAQPKEVVTLEGRRQPLNCLVDYVSFSAHVDFVQNRSFIQQVAPKHVILVHGQKDEMGRFKSALMLQYKSWPESKRPTITMPPNLQEVKLRFARRRTAKVMGRLVKQKEDPSTKQDEDETMEDPEQTKPQQQPSSTIVEPVAGENVQGICVTQNFHSKIVAPEDLASFTPLRVGTVSSKLHVPFAGSCLSLLQVFLQEMFAGMTVTTNKETETTVFQLGDLVQVVIVGGKKAGTALVEWDANPQGDVLADAVISLIMHAQSSAATVRMTSEPCSHYRPDQHGDHDDDGNPNKRAKIRPETVESRLKLIHSTLKEQFDTVEAVYEGNQGVYEIQTDCGFLPPTASGDKKKKKTKQDDEAVNQDNDDGLLKCQVTVMFEPDDSERAHIAVESRDSQLANNVRDCIQNLTHATQPLSLETASSAHEPGAEELDRDERMPVKSES